MRILKSSKMKSLALSSFLGLALLAASAQAAEYQIDTSHSEITFKIKHMGISTVTGKFEKFGGTFSVDPKDIKSTKGMASIDVNSINTSNVKRDGHLKAEDFFDVQKFPAINFVSKSVKDINEKDSTCILVGDLTMHGITKEITLNVKGGGIVNDGWGNERAAFMAKGSINRFDFGLSWSKLLESGGLVVSKEVVLELNFEGVRPAPVAPAVVPAPTKSGKPAKAAK